MIFMMPRRFYFWQYNADYFAIQRLLYETPMHWLRSIDSGRARLIFMMMKLTGQLQGFLRRERRCGMHKRDICIATREPRDAIHIRQCIGRVKINAHFSPLILPCTHSRNNGKTKDFADSGCR